MSALSDARDRTLVMQIIEQAAKDQAWLPPQPYPLLVHRLAAHLAAERKRTAALVIEPIEKLADMLDGEACLYGGGITGDETAERIRMTLADVKMRLERIGGL